jgi:hypothetical protein
MAEMRSKGWKTIDGRHIVAKPLDYVSKNRDTSRRFKSLGKDERKRIDQREKKFRTYRKKRHDWETKKADRPKERSYRGFKPTKVKTLRSPIQSKSRDQFEKKKTSPNRYKAPKPDLNVEPLKRRHDYNRRDSREKDSYSGWNPDARRRKRNDRGINTDDRGRMRTDGGKKSQYRRRN